MSALTTYLAEQKDVDLQLSRRSLYISQLAWEGAARSLEAVSTIVGWHGSKTHRETGAVALVPLEGGLSDLVGDIIRVTRLGDAQARSVLVYVVGRIDTDFGLTIPRRAFQELGLLANESLPARVERIT